MWLAESVERWTYNVYIICILCMFHCVKVSGKIPKIFLASLLVITFEGSNRNVKMVTFDLKYDSFDNIKSQFTLDPLPPSILPQLLEDPITFLD